MELCIFCGKENEDASRYCCCCGMEIQDEELQNSIAQQTSLGEKPVTVQSLESVILPNRMENIGQRAFFGCNDLRKIQIPEGVSTIEVETFQRCSRLKEIKFPESLNEIQENAFVFQWSNCDGILSGME